VHGGEREDLGAAVEGGEVDVRDRAEELDSTLRGERAEQLRVLALRRGGIVSGRTHHPEDGIVGERFDEAVDALVRRQPSDEEDAVATTVRVRPEASRIRAAVHDPRSRSRRSKLARRIGGYREEAVEEPREQPCPIPAPKAVVGDRRWDPSRARVEGGEPARRAPQVMRMDDVSP
jgi:hypothetical protein